MGELIVRNDRLNHMFKETTFAFLDLGNKRFDDDIHDFTFFMDGNTLRQKEIRTR